MKPRIKIWNCAGYYIYPSLSAMVNISERSFVSLRPKPKRFIELLLESSDVVTRDKTRRVVFGIHDPKTEQELKSNNIDQHATYCRRYFGAGGPQAVSGEGHYFHPSRYLCEGAELDEALALYGELNGFHA